MTTAAPKAKVNMIPWHQYLIKVTVTCTMFVTANIQGYCHLQDNVYYCKYTGLHLVKMLTIWKGEEFTSHIILPLTNLCLTDSGVVATICDLIISPWNFCIGARSDPNIHAFTIPPITCAEIKNRGSNLVNTK